MLRGGEGINQQNCLFVPGNEEKLKNNNDDNMTGFNFNSKRLSVDPDPPEVKNGMEPLT